MKSFLMKVAMFFCFAMTAGLIWCGINLVFAHSIWNILLGMGGVFFFFRGLEFVDIINKLGAYNPDNEDKGKKEDDDDDRPFHHGPGPRFGDSQPEDGSDLMEE